MVIRRGTCDAAYRTKRRPQPATFFEIPESTARKVAPNVGENFHCLSAGRQMCKTINNKNNKNNNNNNKTHLPLVQKHVEFIKVLRVRGFRLPRTEKHPKEPHTKDFPQKLELARTIDNQTMTIDRP
eukprot:4096844-Amphidinium_carterae.2